MNKQAPLIIEIIIISAIVCGALVVTEAHWLPILGVHPGTGAVSQISMVQPQSRQVQGTITVANPSQKFLVVQTSNPSQPAQSIYEKIYFTPNTTVSALTLQQEKIAGNSVNVYSTLQSAKMNMSDLKTGQQIQVQIKNDLANHRYVAASIMLLQFASSTTSS